jgi:hypothetical protein
MNLENIEKQLFSIVKDEITHQLTLGRQENNLDPYSNEQMDDFFKRFQSEIETIIHEMVEWENTNADVNNLLEDSGVVMENIYERIDIEQYISNP